MGCISNETTSWEPMTLMAVILTPVCTIIWQRLKLKISSKSQSANTYNSVWISVEGGIFQLNILKN